MPKKQVKQIMKTCVV